MLIKCLTVGSYETNCYIVTDEATLECAVIDPGADAGAILDYLESNKLNCRFVLLTHGHFDHTGAVESLREETGAGLCMSRKDDGVTIGGEYYRYTAPKDAQFLAEGDSVSVGSLNFTAMETPGHTPGGLTYLCTQAGKPDRALFTGDTLFRDSCGRTDFPGSSTDDMLSSLRRLAALEGDWEVYPGHMDSTTLDRERKFNYFIQMALRG